MPTGGHEISRDQEDSSSRTNLYEKNAIRLVVSIVLLPFVVWAIDVTEVDLKVSLEGYLQPLADQLASYASPCDTILQRLRAYFASLLLTSLVQSSSLSLRMLFEADGLPVTEVVLGANVGTTVTSVCFCLVVSLFGKAAFRLASEAATLHLFVNAFGVLVVWPADYHWGLVRRVSVLASSRIQAWVVANGREAEYAESMPLEISVAVFLVLLFLLLMFVVYIWNACKYAWESHGLSGSVGKAVNAVSEAVLRIPAEATSIYSLLLVMSAVLLTTFVLSSSIITVVVVALVASGALTIETSLPLILGANIGTTISVMHDAIQLGGGHIEIGIVHFLFNVIAVALVALSYRWGRFPIRAAVWAGRRLSGSRSLAALAIFSVFYGLPAFVLILK